MADEQGVLIDVSHPLEKDIERLAKKIRGHDKDRSEAQGKADEARGELLTLLTKAEIHRWVKGDLDITVKIADAKVSVKKRGDKSDEDD